MGAAGAVRGLPAGDVASPGIDRSGRVHRRRPRGGAIRPTSDPRLRQQPAARPAGRERRDRARLSVRVHRSARPVAALAPHCHRRRGATAPRVAAVHDRDRDDFFVRTARAHHLRSARTQGSHRLRPREHVFFRGADLLSNRLSDAAAAARRDRLERRRHGVLPRGVPLAGLSHGDAAAHHSGARQRVPAAVRGVARRLCDSVDPRRQPVSGAADPSVLADHGLVRPARRRRLVLRAASAGSRRLPAAALLGEPPLLRDDHRQGGGPNAVRQHLAGHARGSAGCLRDGRARRGLFLRAAALRLARRGTGR